MQTTYKYSTIIGKIVITEENEKIIAVKFENTKNEEKEINVENISQIEEIAINAEKKSQIEKIAINTEKKNNKIKEIAINAKKLQKDNQIKETPLIKETYNQIAQYLEGKRKQFDIPFKLKGTPFQLKVWNALLTIPYGETRNYQEIAQKISSKKACRAVGMANHNNPISIIVPCHRVIGKNGKLVGYGGGLDIKETLLEIEQKSKTNTI